MSLLATLASILTGVSILYWILTTYWLGQWLSPKLAGPKQDLPPISFLRPLKPNIPNLEAKLRQFLTSLTPDDQALFGVEPNSAEELLCHRMASEFDQNIQVISCTQTAALNPKISKLLQLAQHTRHSRWLLLDSEAALPPGWLDRFRAEWLQGGAAVLTAGYRFEDAYSWPQRLDALPALLTLWPGLAAVQRWGTVRFNLGACTAGYADDLADVGGWAAFGDCLAEDHQLGVALAAAGKRIELSGEVLPLGSDLLGGRDWWRHQARIALTYRVANPLGYAGLVATHGIAWAAVFALAVGGWEGVGLFLVVGAVRWTVAHEVARILGASPGTFAEVLIASMAETVCWAWSWTGRRVWWAQKWRRVDSRGRLVGE